MVNRAAAEAEPPDIEELDDDAIELLEVPAAIVCANCGDPECPGCVEIDETTQTSGVVAVIPWERPGMTVSQRMVSTARLATVNAESFFAALPAGGIANPLRFAILAELLAIGSLAVAWAPVLYACAPWFWNAVWLDAAARETLLAVLVLGIPAAAGLMVALHVVWGLSLELGVRRSGRTPKWQRGLRFALYSCGWDAVTSPYGIIALGLADGPTKGFSAAKMALRVPGKATRAYARGIHQLSREETRRAARTAWTITAALLVVASIGAVVGAVVLSF